MEAWNRSIPRIPTYTRSIGRALRLEFCSARYHVTSRGDRGERIYENDEEHERFLEILGRVVPAINWICHACWLMDDHNAEALAPLAGTRPERVAAQWKLVRVALGLRRIRSLNAP